MDALLAIVLLPLFLLPCAIQDWRSHHISNWLTIPAFLTAWVAALTLDHITITIAVFLGCYLAWSMKWMGAADSKLATLVAAVAPLAIIFGTVLLCCTFCILRLSGGTKLRLPAVPYFYMGTLVEAILQSSKAPSESMLEYLGAFFAIRLLAMGMGILLLAFLLSAIRRLLY